MSERFNIEELVRTKMEQAEITPSQGAWKGVQRQLRMKQFLRFDPGRFNLYYLGGLLVAGAVAISLLSIEPARDEPRTNVTESTLQTENKRFRAMKHLLKPPLAKAAIPRERAC